MLQKVKSYDPKIADKATARLVSTSPTAENHAVAENFLRGFLFVTFLYLLSMCVRSRDR